MPYQLTSADQQKIVFERNVSGCSRALFIAVGAIFLLVGCGINLLPSGFIFPFALFKIFFPLFGLGAIAVGIFLPKIGHDRPRNNHVRPIHFLRLAIIPAEDFPYSRKKNISRFSMNVTIRWRH